MSTFTIMPTFIFTFTFAEKFSADQFRQHTIKKKKFHFHPKLYLFFPFFTDTPNCSAFSCNLSLAANKILISTFTFITTFTFGRNSLLLISDFRQISDWALSMVGTQYLRNSHLLSSGSTLSRIASQASWTVNSASSFPTASSSGRRAAPTNLASKCSFPSRRAFEYLSPPLSIPVMVQQGQPQHFALCILPENWFQLIG